MERACTGVIHCVFDQIPNQQNCFTTCRQVPLQKKSRHFGFGVFIIILVHGRQCRIDISGLGPFPKIIRIRLFQGVTKKCRLSWLTNSALVYEPKCGGGAGITGLFNEYSCAPRRRAQINFGDLTLYLTYGFFTL